MIHIPWDDENFDFPVDVFPAPVRDYILTASRWQQTDPSAVGTLILGHLAGAAMRRYRAPTTTLCLITVLDARPSTRKTGAMKLCEPLEVKEITEPPWERWYYGKYAIPDLTRQFKKKRAVLIKQDGYSIIDSLEHPKKCQTLLRSIDRHSMFSANGRARFCMCLAANVPREAYRNLDAHYKTYIKTPFWLFGSSSFTRWSARCDETNSAKPAFLDYCEQYKSATSPIGEDLQEVWINYEAYKVIQDSLPEYGEELTAANIARVLYIADNCGEATGEVPVEYVVKALCLMRYYKKQWRLRLRGKK